MAKSWWVWFTEGICGVIDNSADTQIHLKAHSYAIETSSVLSNNTVFLTNKSIYVHSKTPLSKTGIFFFSRNFGSDIVAFKWTSNSSIISVWKQKTSYKEIKLNILCHCSFQSFSGQELSLFVSQHSVIDLPGEAVLDVGEAGGGQQGGVLSGRPLPALRLNQHVEGVELHGERAWAVFMEQRLHQQHGTSCRMECKTETKKNTMFFFCLHLLLSCRSSSHSSGRLRSLEWGGWKPFSCTRWYNKVENWCRMATSVFK